MTDANFQTCASNVYAVGALRSGYAGGIVSALGEGAAEAAAAVGSFRMGEG